MARVVDRRGARWLVGTREAAFIIGTLHGWLNIEFGYC